MALAPRSTLAASPAAVQSTHAPIADFIGFGGAISGATIGWSFKVGKYKLPVTSLGVYDGDGLVNGHQVGLWNDSKTLLASTTIKSGNASSADAGYRYEPVSVTLAAGQTYVVGAFFPAASHEKILFESAQTISPFLAILQSRQGSLSPSSTFGFPNLDAGLPHGLFGPNLRYAAFDVGGSVSGLVSTLVLHIDGVPEVTISQNGTYKFPSLPDQNSYEVTIPTQPNDQICTLANKDVTLAGSDVSNVDVTCTTVDAGPLDAGDAGEFVDAGATDAGASPSDGGATEDSAPPGIPDAGSLPVDAGIEAPAPSDDGCSCHVGREASLRLSHLLVAIATATALRRAKRRRKP